MLLGEFFQIEDKTNKIDPGFLKRSARALKHYGRKGQKWGIRNGPPYPLDRQKTYTRTKKGGRSIATWNILTYSDLAAVGSLGLKLTKKAIAAIREHTYNKLAIQDARSKVQRVLNRSNGETKNGFRTLSKQETVDEAMTRTNPWADTLGGKQNCIGCSLASYLRTQGYDVVASPRGVPLDDVKTFKKVIKNYDEVNKDFKQNDIGHTEESAAKYILETFGGKDGIGLLGVTWSPAIGGGHVFNWQIQNGKVKFFDSQCNKSNDYAKDYFKHIAYTNEEQCLIRLTDADFDFDALRKLKVVE